MPGQDQHLLVTGNPVDGLQFIGPFQHPEDANFYAEMFLNKDEWWVAKLEAPVELPAEIQEEENRL